MARKKNDMKYKCLVCGGKVTKTGSERTTQYTCERCGVRSPYDVKEMK